MVKSNVRVTVLRRTSGWSIQAAVLLSARLAVDVFRHPMSPGTLIIAGAFSREAIERAVGDSNFYLEYLDGLDNPSLPFMPNREV